jgi:hypothetical protein
MRLTWKIILQLLGGHCARDFLTKITQPFLCIHTIPFTATTTWFVALHWQCNLSFVKNEVYEDTQITQLSQYLHYYRITVTIFVDIKMRNLNWGGRISTIHYIITAVKLRMNAEETGCADQTLTVISSRCRVQLNDLRNIQGRDNTEKKNQEFKI